MGGLGNSIYVRYDPNEPFSAHQQYADVVVQQREELNQRQQELQDLRDEQEARDGQANQQLLTATLVSTHSLFTMLLLSIDCIILSFLM